MASIIRIDTKTLLACASELNRVCDSLERAASQINGARNGAASCGRHGLHSGSVDLDRISRSIQASNVNSTLTSYSSALRQYQDAINRLSKNLRSAAAAFDDTEKRLLEGVMRALDLAKGSSDGPGINSLGILNGVVSYVAGTFGNDDDHVCQGDPVNMATGNFFYSRTYLPFGDCQQPLSLQLFYNAQDQTAGCLGDGWLHNYEVCLAQQDAQWVARMGDGMMVRFEEKDGSFVQYQGGKFTLSRLDDGFLLEDENLVRYRFDTNGRLVSTGLAGVREIQLHYEQSRLISLENGYGDEYLFSYEEDGRLLKVSDGKGRSVELRYRKGLLTSIIDPEQNVRAFTYSKQRLLETITDERGVVTLRNAYDAQGRIIRQKMPDGGVMNFQYHDKEKLVVFTDQSGNIIHYEHNDQNQCTRATHVSGEERFDYDEHSRLSGYTDRLNHTTRYAFDQQGNLSRITNPRGDQVHIAYTDARRISELGVNNQWLFRARYDQAHRLTEVEDVLGRIERLRYDPEGLLTEVRQPDDSHLHFEYDELGNVSSYTDAQGRRRQYAYDAFHRLICATEPSGAQTKYAYNTNGDVTEVINALGQKQTRHYSEAGDLLYVTDYDGYTEAYEYDASRQPIAYTDKQGRVTRYEYDALRHITCRVDPNGGETRYAYNAAGQLQMVTDAQGNSQQLQYDACNNLLQRTAADGGVYSFEYDAMNRPVSVTDPMGVRVSAQYDAQGNITRIVDGAGSIYEAEYDALGQLCAEKRPNGHIVHYTYQNMGLVDTISDNYGILKRFHYLPGGLLAWEENADDSMLSYEYDANGNISSCTNQDGFVRSFRYDALNRVSEQRNSDGLFEFYAYDKAGNLSSVTDSFGQTTQYAYSPTGKLIGVVDAKGNASYYTYDAMDELQRIVRPNEGLLDMHLLLALRKTDERARVTSFERDLLGQLRASTDAAGATTQYDYDTCGRICGTRDADGFLTRYGYHADGQRASVAYADGRTVSMEYSPLKKLTKLTDWLGTVTLQYDACGETTRIEDQNGEEMRYAYDLRGMRTELIYPDQAKAEYQYDNASRLEQITFGAEQVRYEYAANGRLTAKYLPLGMNVRYDYDEQGRLSTRTHSDAQGMLEQFAYQYDAPGHRCGMTVQAREGGERKVTYAYQYDSLGFLTGVTKNGQALRSYAYDAFGNRTAMETPEGKTSYRYNALDQLTERVFGSQVSRYAYDGRGNLVEGDGEQFAFDAANRIKSATGAGSGQRFEYDGFGMRVMSRLTEGGHESESRYLLDRTKVCENLLGVRTDGHQQDFLWGDALLLGRQDHKTRVYLADERQTLLRTVLPDGSSMPWQTDEFGVSPENAPSPFSFGGYRDDGIQSLLFANKREYAPRLGRFISPDAVEGDLNDPKSLNRYAYCQNDPINYYDPTGCILAWLAAGIVGTVKRLATKVATDVFTYATTGKWEGRWQDYVGQAAGGFAEGTVFALTGNSTLAGAAGDATAAFTTGMSDMISSGDVSWERFGKVMQDTATGAVTGAVSGFIFGKVSTKLDGISKGRGNMDSVWRGLMTKTANGTIKNMAGKSLIKGIISQGVVGGFVDTIKNAAKDYVKNKAVELGGTLLTGFVGKILPSRNLGRSSCTA